MGMARSRKEAMVETRKALIEAGIDCFGTEGLDASLDHICARAGFTRGAFYVHFRDREEFLVAVMDRVGAEFLDTVFAAGDLPATAARFVQAMASGDYPLTRKGGVRPHQLLDACARSEAVRERYVALIARSLEQMEALVLDGQTGRPRFVREDVSARSVAALLMAAIIGAQTMMELEVPLEPATLAGTMLALLEPRRR